MKARIVLWAIFLWAPRLRTITHQLLIAYTAGQVTPQTHGRRTDAQPRTTDMQGNRKDAQSPRRRKRSWKFTRRGGRGWCGSGAFVDLVAV